MGTYSEAKVGMDLGGKFRILRLDEVFGCDIGALDGLANNQIFNEYIKGLISHLISMLLTLFRIY